MTKKICLGLIGISFIFASNLFANPSQSQDCNTISQHISQMYPNITDRARLEKVASLETKACLKEITKSDQFLLDLARSERQSWVSLRSYLISQWKDENPGSNDMPSVVELCDQYYSRVQIIDRDLVQSALCDRYQESTTSVVVQGPDPKIKQLPPLVEMFDKPIRK